MSLTTVPPARGSAMPAAPSSAPTPRALIDYDFQSVLAAPPRRRVVLWLMIGLVAFAAAALAMLQVDVVVSANPGCHMQLEAGLKQRGSKMKVQHVTELLASAY